MTTHDAVGPPGAAPALELRVHGVSGTPPEDLLDRPLVDQISGDSIAGFYAPRLGTERRDSAPNVFVEPRANAAELVGYSWGGLTSGSPARALWLLLLPLTLSNVAPRARPGAAAHDSARVAAIWYTARLLALTLTCLYAITGVGIGEDLIGWQCVSGTSCTKANPHWVFHHISAHNRLSVEHMLLLGAVLPVLVLLLIWLVSTRTANRYERTVGLGVAPETATDTNAVELPLSSALMWRNAEQVRRLRAVHMQVGFAAVLWSLLGATEGPWRHWYDLRGHWWVLVPLAVLGYALVALALPSFTGHGQSTRWRIASGVVWAVLLVAGAVQVFGLAVAHRWVSDNFLHRAADGSLGARTPDGGLPYFSGTVAALCIAAVVALFLLLVVLVVARTAGTGGAASGEHKELKPALWGFTSGAFAALGLFLAAGFTAGAYTFSAAYLNTGTLKPGFAQVTRVFKQFPGVPSVVFTAGIAYAVSVVLLAGLLLVTVLIIALQFLFRPGHLHELAKDYPDAASATDADGKVRRREIQRAMFLGRLVDAVPWFVGWLVLTGLVILVWFSVKLLRAGGDRPRYAVGSISTGWLSAPSLAAMGSYFAVMTLVALVSLGALAFRVQKSRRVVGILWDVASFWPRACHPLSAPCYAERTVPDLVTFVSAHCIDNPEARVVLTAHSQGTVISAATIRQLDTFDNEVGVDHAHKVVPRLSFVSCGCVLRRLYGRYFPAYFGPSQLHELQRVLTTGNAPRPRWRNLWRYTDYLGGQVTAGPPQVIPETPAPTREQWVVATTPPVVGPTAWEWHSPDPPFFDRQSGDTTYSRADRHSNFWSDPSGYLQLAVHDLLKKRPTPGG